MEAAVPVRGGLGASSCPDLASIFERSGSFISCYLDTDAEAEDAPHRIEIRWKDIRRTLERSGGQSRDLDAIAGALGGARTLGGCVGIVANAGEVLLREGGERELGTPIARVAPIPSLGQVLAWRQHRVAYVAVACDRAGADISVSAPGMEIAIEAGDEDVHDPILHKFRGGGWSHRRIQQRVENAWEKNAEEVLQVLEELASKVQPRVIIYGGDVHACALLEEHALASLRPLLEQAAISRALDGSERHEPEVIRRVLETAVASDTAQLLHQVRDLKAKRLGIAGPDAVLAALTASQAETLLIHDDPRDERTAYLSRSPFACGVDRETAEAFGEPVPGRLVDVAIAGAFFTGASVRMTPGTAIEGGIAAILRFPG